MRTQRPPAITIASPSSGNQDRFAELRRHATPPPSSSFEAARALRTGEIHRIRSRRTAIQLGVAAVIVLLLLVTFA